MLGILQDAAGDELLPAAGGMDASSSGCLYCPRILLFAWSKPKDNRDNQDNELLLLTGCFMKLLRNCFMKLLESIHFVASFACLLLLKLESSMHDIASDSKMTLR